MVEIFSTGELPKKFCVVGAGPGGLIAARALRNRGVEVDILERYSEIGGIWNINQPGSPMYESCNFISSKSYGGFVGYPMPAHYPDYPRWDQVLEYVRAFARSHGLEPLVQFNIEVTSAEPVRDTRGEFWRVTLSTGEVREYRGVVYAGGAQWEPYVPGIEGWDTFTGRGIHATEYRRPQEFDGQRVLIVGAGNSGVDIAADAAQRASKAILSTRRGYWFFPKQIFGVPSPDLLTGSAPLPEIPVLGNVPPERVGELVLASVGDLTRYGLPAPDHQVAATHPIMNNQVLHYLSHGKLEWRPDIERIEGSTVLFKDGRQDDFDVIILATGYDVNIPWLPEGAIRYEQGHPEFHLGTFVDGATGLYGMGMLHLADNAYTIFDRLAQLIAADALAILTGENAENMRKIKEEFRPDLKADFPFLNVRRNVNQLDVGALRAAIVEIEERFGIPMPDYLDEYFYAGLRLDRAGVQA